MKTQLTLDGSFNSSNKCAGSWIVLRCSAWLLATGLFSGMTGCTSPQNCQPYPNYPSYPGYPPAYTLPSGTTVPTVGAPAVGSAVAQPPVMGQPLPGTVLGPGTVPAYPTLAPGQPIPPGYTTGIPAR